MRDSLKGVLSRVKRLTTDAALKSCGGNHRRHRSIIVHGDEPVPPWPEAESGERCSCGSKLEYFQIIHELRPARERSQGDEI